jgi:hypothetical protein
MLHCSKLIAAIDKYDRDKTYKSMELDDGFLKENNRIIGD